jgi:hypothetical protein
MAMSLMGLMEGTVSQARIMNDTDILKSLQTTLFEVLRVKQHASPLAAR